MRWDPELRSTTPHRHDVVLAGALGVLAMFDVLLTPDWRGPGAVNLVVAAAMAGSVAWRRALPLLPLTVTTVGVLGLGLAYGSSQTWTNVFVVAVVVYSAAAHSARLLLVVLLTAVASLGHAVLDPLVHSFGDAIWSSSLSGVALLAGLAGRRIRQRSTALDAYAEQLEREDAERAEAVAAEERRRIARELHDIVSHGLGLIVLQAGAAEQALDRNPEQVREVLRSMRRTGQDAIGEMGTLLGAIRADARPEREPQPSLGDLEALVSRTRDAGLPVDADIRLTGRPLSAAVQLSAYRVAQEALTNVLKHAPGAATRVTVAQRDGLLEVQVVNGPAPDGQQAQGSRQGLLGLAERLSIFGGRLTFGPCADGGWSVHASFPVAS